MKPDMYVGTRRASVGDAEIQNDRDLLKALGDMRDTEASFYLGRSRQAINSQLGSKKSGKAPDDYFKLGDIILLVIAARQAGKSFDEEAIRRYVERTRKGKEGAGSYEMFELVIGKQEPLDVSNASAVILLVPDFTDLLRRPAAVQPFEKLAADLRENAGERKVVLMSTTRLRAERAAEALGLKGDNVYSSSHEYVDHYIPMVLIFDKGKTPQRPGDTPRAYALSDKDEFVPAPEYRVRAMSECILYMLPGELRESIFPPVAGQGKIAT